MYKMANRFVLNETSYHGKGAIAEIATEIKARAFKNTNDVELPLNKIIQAGNVNITEIEQQSKVGRAIIGGMLFGNAGAIVGAMTAGEKQKIKTLYIINYSSNNEKKVIILKGNGGNLNYVGFQKRLNELLPKTEQ